MIALQTLRNEGVLDVGAIPGTSFVYVITRARMCFAHAAELPRRRLDAYGAKRACYWIERGSTTYQVAADLGVSQEELRRALLSIGYARLSPAEIAHLEDARAARKIGNRRGRIERVERIKRIEQIAALREPREDPAAHVARKPTFNDRSATAGLAKKKKKGVAAAPVMTTASLTSA